MSLIVKETGKALKPPKAGPQQAVCAFVEDIGTQRVEYAGEKKNVQKVVICWELAELMEDKRPFMLSKSYTISLNAKSNLRKDIEAWRGKTLTKEQLNGFDLESLIGANCLINVIHKEREDGSVRALIGAIMPTNGSMPKLKVYNEKPPEWIAKQRAESIEAGSSSSEDDPIPF